MASLIRDRAATSAAMLKVFGDRALLDAALRYEAELAGALAEEGLIPADAAIRIRALCAGIDIDIDALAEAAAHAGTLAIPLVDRLRDAAGADGPHVHRGGTSQDLADTALMLQVRDAACLIEGDLERLLHALASHALEHAHLPMLGRTLLQAALPVTFGLKAAQWMLAIRSGLDRFRREIRSSLLVQFGGGAGTHAGLAGHGQRIAARMARELGLSCPVLPWHARRDSIAGIAASLAIVIGALGKIARDLALLAQGEVAEAFEPRQPGRGGSSVMPNKRNPTGCQVALSAAARAPGLAAAILGGLPQEHERGLGGWQAEAPVLADLFCLAHGATQAMLPVLEQLELDPVRMAANLTAADVGSNIGESAELARQVAGPAVKERTPLPAVTLATGVAGSPALPALLLLHSLGCDGEMWALQIAALQDRFRLIVPDLRGHGRSEASAGCLTLADLSEDILAVLDRENIRRAHVCGISLGGAIAQWLAAERPERVDRLVLANTAARIGSSQSWREREALVRAGGMTEIADTVLERFFTAEFRRRRPEVAERFRRRLLETSTNGYAGCCTALENADLTACLARITSPTLVVGGSADASTPLAQSRALAASIPGARLVVLEAAHLSNIEVPKAFTETLRQHLEA